MIASSIRLLGAALLTMTSLSAANAQTAGAPTTISARAPHHHHKTKPEPEGRQITVRKSTPSWLTLGTQAPVGYGNNYVTDTFDQPSPIANTNAGSRGRMGLGDDNRFDGSGIPLIRF